jgi:hypothetical protein
MSAGTWWIRALVGTAVLLSIFALAWIKIVNLGT